MKLKILFFINKIKYKVTSKFCNIKKDYLIIISIIIFTLIFNGINDNNADSPSNSNELNFNQSSIDTHIPKGYVLIPIELVNFKSIRGIIGRLAIVDLYLQRTSKSNLPINQPIVSSIRLIQAPNNNNQIAILVPENKANLFLGDKLFFATIQNPKNYQTKYYKKIKEKPRRIYINQNKEI